MGRDLFLGTTELQFHMSRRNLEAQDRVERLRNSAFAESREADGIQTTRRCIEGASVQGKWNNPMLLRAHGDSQAALNTMFLQAQQRKDCPSGSTSLGRWSRHARDRTLCGMGLMGIMKSCQWAEQHGGAQRVQAVASVAASSGCRRTAQLQAVVIRLPEHITYRRALQVLGSHDPLERTSVKGDAARPPAFQPLVPSKEASRTRCSATTTTTGRLKPRNSSSRLRADSWTPLHAPNQASVSTYHVVPRV
ncbi:hypothetical protein PsorP6_015176 [Peronosclerospora sorghi]|uniref:Uncharacterized protein n=1 Tax=Peronosclerospora sorghi TaxID=230839 RepID=A0ACC0VTQ5_9STRA|nr:hypothetical protein PsorP6_015176 [Peronosclerospora sorghi]